MIHHQTPSPTTNPKAGLDLEYLDYSYPPSDISGHDYLSRAVGGEVYKLNIQSEEVPRLTHDYLNRYAPVISKRCVAWTEYLSPIKWRASLPQATPTYWTSSLASRVASRMCWPSDGSSTSTAIDSCAERTGTGEEVPTPTPNTMKGRRYSGCGPARLPGTARHEW